MDLAESVLMAADLLEKSLEDNFHDGGDALLVKHHVRMLRTMVKMSREDAPAAESGEVHGDAPPSLARVHKVFGTPVLGQKAKAPSVLTAPAGQDPWERAWSQGEQDRLKALAEKRELQAREELKAQVLREEAGTDMVEAVGGDSDGVMVPVDPRMPVGAKTLLSKQVYVLSGERKFVFSQEETDKMRGK